MVSSRQGCELASLLEPGGRTGLKAGMARSLGTPCRQNCSIVPLPIRTIDFALQMDKATEWALSSFATVSEVVIWVTQLSRCFG